MSNNGKKSILPKWWEVYCSDEEKRVFVGQNGISGLVRHTKYDWRSIESIASEANLSKDIVERIIMKYIKLGVVILNSGINGEKYGYWENVAKELGNASGNNLVETDIEDKINKVKKK